VKKKYAVNKATVVVDALGGNVLSSVGDSAVADVEGMSNVSVYVNLEGVYAILALGLTEFNTTVVARVAGATPHVVVTHGAPTKAGTIAEVGNVVTLTYDTGVSTVADMEALIATSTLIKTLTPGTQANILATPGDDKADTALSLTGSTFSIDVLKSSDGVNFSLVSAVTQANVSAANKAFELTLSDSNGMPTTAKLIKVALTTLGQTAGTTQFTAAVGGLLDEDHK